MLHVGTLGHYSLTIYDMAGREVMNLFDGVLTPGPHQFVWNIDASRRRTASGTYFCRLRSSTSTQTIKVVFVR
jgi:hypothetical protein